MIWANFFHIYQPPRWPRAIIAKVARESYRPLLHILNRHSHVKITLNISGSLTEQLARYNFQDILKNIRRLAQKKQIELVGTAINHPILPLLPEREIIRQIELNSLVNKKHFGRHYQPRGFFPPEMCSGPKVVKILEKLKYQWLILDEISAFGKLSKISFNQTYVAPKTKFQYIFRNRVISDWLSFHSNINAPAGFWQSVRQDKRSDKILITAMDGENLGHHRPGLNRLWEKLVGQKNIKTVTISELLENYKKEKAINPLPASWSAREIELKRKNPYGLWRDPQNPIHHWQWRLVNYVIRLTNKRKSHKQYQRARRLLDQQLASDQFWWASAKPWWSIDIIKDKTKELVQTASLIDGGKQAGQIAERIIATASEWQSEKRFAVIAQNYLAAEERDNVRFIGGKKISIR